MIGTPLRRAAALLLPLLLTLSVLSLNFASATPTAAIASGAIFNVPTSASSAERNAVRDRIISLVNAANPGSTIKIAMFHLWSQTVANALANAHTDPNRQVNVQVIEDETAISDAKADLTSYNILKTALGTDTTRSSFITLCPPTRSCLGDQTVSGIMHNKFALFSSVNGATNVVVQTSSNLTPSSYDKMWNSASVVADNIGVYNAYDWYFKRLIAKDPAAWTYAYSSSGAYKTYFFPRPGGGAADDTIVGILDNVTCSWSDGSTARQTVIRVAMYQLLRQAVADKLAGLQRAGCAVDVVYTRTDTGTWDALHFAGGPQMRCYNLNDDNDPNTQSLIVHSKYMLIDGWYNGRHVQSVWTGSHNYTGPALTTNDEALLKIEDSTSFSAYLGNFNTVRAAARPGTADNVTECKTLNNVGVPAT
ncbi:hypothetical protein GCM10023237_09360 [Streptomyces coeruleoprunus]